MVLGVQSLQSPRSRELVQPPSRHRYQEANRFGSPCGTPRYILWVSGTTAVFVGQQLLYSPLLLILKQMTNVSA